MSKNTVTMNIGQDNVLVAGYSRHIVNDMSDDEIGSKVLEVLMKIIEEYTPHFEHNNDANTRAKILWFERYECPCCSTSASALVKIDTNGRCSECRDMVASVCGLYSVEISACSCNEADGAGSKFSIAKLNRTEFARGTTTLHLPSQSERKQV